MEEQGTDFTSALAEAQRLGYAEPIDEESRQRPGQKLAILAHLAFGGRAALGPRSRASASTASNGSTCILPRSWATEFA